MTKEEKKILRNNVIKFVIWWILLAFSFVYLHNHPAEKETVLSGFKIIWQKIQVIVQKIIWDNWELLEKKYNMEKYYKELLSLAENKKCIESTILTELNEKYNNLLDESIDTLEDNIADYSSFLYRVDPLIKADCPITD